MRTLRVAQTSPLDVHRRFPHVLKMNSQIRASRFARFRRVVGLSRVFHHGCFPRICVLRLCFITTKAVSLPRKKERKKKGPDQLGFNTLNVFLLFPQRRSNAREKGRKEVKEEDKGWRAKTSRCARATKPYS